MPVMEKACKFLDDMQVPFEVNALSAHRTPDAVEQFAKGAKERGLRVIIAGAGMAAALPGVIAASTTLPVIGVPIKGMLDGLDALLSIIQMPPGIPVATVGVNAAMNAAILAVEMLSLSDPDIARRLADYKAGLGKKIEKANRETEPPHGVEHEDAGEGEQRAAHAPYGRRVRGDLPPHVYHGTHHLYEQRRHEDTAHEMGYVAHLHEVETKEIAQYGDDVRHHAAFLRAELHGRPALVTAVEVYQHGGDEYGEHIHHGEHESLIAGREHAEVGEEEQHCQSEDGQIERREDDAHHACGKDDGLVVHCFLILATGMPSCSLYLAMVRRAIG